MPKYKFTLYLLTTMLTGWVKFKSTEYFWSSRCKLSHSQINCKRRSNITTSKIRLPKMQRYLSISIEPKIPRINKERNRETDRV